MGTLDDAIREHLDLKRKHGSSEEELEREEAEALGQLGADPAADVASAGAQAGEQPPLEPPLEQSLPLEHEPDEALPADVLEGEPEHELESESEPAARPEPVPEVVEPAPLEPEPEPLEPTLPAEDEIWEDAEFADSVGPSEEVLEETPDFLEETPEHDQLWFEQRPPKDFDFD